MYITMTEVRLALACVLLLAAALGSSADLLAPAYPCFVGPAAAAGSKTRTESASAASQGVQPSSHQQQQQEQQRHRRRGGGGSSSSSTASSGASPLAKRMLLRRGLARPKPRAGSGARTVDPSPKVAADVDTLFRYLYMISPVSIFAVFWSRRVWPRFSCHSVVLFLMSCLIYHTRWPGCCYRFSRSRREGCAFGDCLALAGSHHRHLACSCNGTGRCLFSKHGDVEVTSLRRLELHTSQRWDWFCTTTQNQRYSKEPLYIGGDSRLFFSLRLLLLVVPLLPLLLLYM